MPPLISSPSIWDPKRIVLPEPEPDLDREMPARTTPDVYASLEALKSLNDDPYHSGANDAIKLRGLRESRRSELEGRLATSLGTRSPDAARYAQLLKTLGQDIDEDPYTGVEATQRQQAEEDRRLALRNWMDPQEKMKRTADQNFQLRKIFAGHPPQPGKVDTWGRVSQSPGVIPSADPEAPIQMTGFGQRRDNSGFEGSTELNPFVDALTGKRTTPQSSAQDRDVRIQEMTADLPQEMADVVALLVNRQMDLPKGAVLGKPEWLTIMGRAHAIDPSWTQAGYPMNLQALQAYGPGGKERDNIDSINQIVQHIYNFKEAAHGLNNFSEGPFASAANYGKNTWGEMSGAAPNKTFNIAATLVSGELSKALQRGAVPLEIVNRWHDLLSKSDTPEAYDAAVDEMLELLTPRIIQKQRAYEESTGMPFAAVADKMLTPETRQLLERMDPRNKALHASTAPGTGDIPRQAAPPPPGNAPPPAATDAGRGVPGASMSTHRFRRTY